MTTILNTIELVSHDLVYGVEGRIKVANNTVTLMNGPTSLVLSPMPGDLRIVYTTPRED